MTPTVLVLGDPKVGTLVSEWIAGTSLGRVSVELATRNDRKATLVESGTANFRNLGPVSRSESEMLAHENASQGNFLITCYWPWVLPFSSFEGYSGRTLNFHPSMLPSDRGWYPHVHQIREGRSSGVTLHVLSAEVDCGDIWAQRTVTLPFPLTSGEARLVLESRILKLFKDTWWSIFESKIEPRSQMGDGTYLPKAAVTNLNSLDRDAILPVEEVIRAIASRNSGGKSYIQIAGDAGLQYVHISFSSTGDLTLEKNQDE